MKKKCFCDKTEMKLFLSLCLSFLDENRLGLKNDNDARSLGQINFWNIFTNVLYFFPFQILQKNKTFFKSYSDVLYSNT